MNRTVLDRLTGAAALFGLLLLLFEQTAAAGPYAAYVRQANVGLLFLFLADTVLRLLLAEDRPAHLRAHWLDWIVLVPLLQFVKGVESYAFYVAIRQAVFIIMLISRTKRTNNLVSSMGLQPTQLMIAGFLLTICVGTILLMLPAATQSGERTPLVDALFTATSATCVTGLVVYDTATHFSRLGQVIILALIQVGGLGIMTFSVFLGLLAKRRMNMQQRIVISDVLDQDALSGATSSIAFIVRMTLWIELLGATALFAAWSRTSSNWHVTAFDALFHSVSAFCNAGFSTFSDSLVGFADDLPSNAIICLLVTLGGLGFLAVRDLAGAGRQRHTRLRVQTRIVILVSVLLAGVGALALFALSAPQGGAGTRHQVLSAVFQSVSARTAGFNTIDIGAMGHPALFVMILLMFVGASPGSTGGGLKTTTFAVLWAAMMNGFSRNDQVEILKRTIPAETVQKALTVLLFYIVILCAFVLGLLVTEGERLMDILFEAVSAVATVGLTTGITGELTTPGRLMVTALMFIGRLGPLTIGYALLLTRRRSNYTYAEERVMIG